MQLGQTTTSLLGLAALLGLALAGLRLLLLALGRGLRAAGLEASRNLVDIRRGLKEHKDRRVLGGVASPCPRAPVLRCHVDVTPIPLPAS